MKILIVDDDQLIHMTLKSIFAEEETSSAFTFQEAQEHLAQSTFDVAFLDIQLSKNNGPDGIELLKMIRENSPYLPCIMISGLDDQETVTRCLEIGATDYVVKGSSPDAYRLSTYKAALWRKLMAESPVTRTSPPGVTKMGTEIDKILGRSTAISEMKDMIKRIGHLHGPFLITGATGTGKELVARAIWSLGGTQRPFIAVNCASLPENLVESELFGFEKGAFTGANTSKVGLFEAANGGDIFLDEIGELPLNLQSKLLRVLQEKKVRRLGSERERPIEIRVIAATNVDLLQAVQEKTFRDDLFYRLNVYTLNLPDLKARGDDMWHLAVQFAANNGFKNLVIEEGAKEVLGSYPWPGNIRQLKACMDSMIPYLNPSKPVITKDMAESWVSRNKRPASVVLDSGPYPEVEAAWKNKEPMNVVGLVADYQKRYVEAALKITGDNRSQAAKLLGVSRQRLSNWLTEWGVF